MYDYENGLFIFHRDYRVIDNNGLELIQSKCKNIYTIFIFTPEQVGKGNDFRSNNAILFMIESLEDLNNQLKQSGGKLNCFYGKNNIVIRECINKLNIQYVCYNADYSPYAMKRDDEIHKLCEKMDVVCEYSHDYYLHIPGSILNTTNETYKKFTPYYNIAVKRKVELPKKSHKKHIATITKQISNSISLKDAKIKFTHPNNERVVFGGRSEAVKVLQTALKHQTKYNKTHNTLSLPTSRLSAHIKFGCLSIREVYHAFKNNHDFIRQLIWRDFYANILYSFPTVLNGPMKPSYSKIRWKHNTGWFNSWCKGITGFPIVDAAMRELNTTGYMHNRGRLIVASFLVKTLLINWQHGEKYFAKQLTDYDPASNNGNWQWIAGSGADSQPYFRIFNPWSQSKEYDSDAIYIKKWIPELQDVQPRDIHSWDTSWKQYTNVLYPKPIVDYSDRKEEVLETYKDIFD